MTALQIAILTFSGLVAGAIDAIAGGGGLITLPVLMLILEKGSVAVGTNKVAGTAAALFALLVYARKKLINWNIGIPYALSVGIGSICGSLINPMIPPSVFPILLLVTCPLMLWLIWKRDAFIMEREVHPIETYFFLYFSGMVAGVYDGMWGPGGGTLMFLVLYFVGQRGLLESMACGRLANLLSASFSLVSYSYQGFVNWRVGGVIGAAIAVGALLGAQFGSHRAHSIIRPLLTIIVLLLLLKILMG